MIPAHLDVKPASRRLVCHPARGIQPKLKLTSRQLYGNVLRVPFSMSDLAICTRDFAPTEKIDDLCYAAICSANTETDLLSRTDRILVR